jgi:hypothetical protein
MDLFRVKLLLTEGAAKLKKNVSRSYVSTMLSFCLVIGTTTTAFAEAPVKVNDSSQQRTTSSAAKLKKSKWPAEQAINNMIHIADRPSRTLSKSASVNTLMDSPAFADNRVIVKYKEGASAQAAAQSKKANSSIISVSQIPKVGVSLLEVSKGTDIQALIAKLQLDPNVLYAEPDYKIYQEGDSFNPFLSNSNALSGMKPKQSVSSNVYAPVPAPTDSKFEEQWGLHNTGQTDIDGYVGIPGIDIGALQAWAYSKGNHIVVANIGTGLDMTVPDLQGQIWENTGETPGNDLDDDGNGYIDDVNGWDFSYNDNTLFDIMDRLNDYEGTQIAGVIAAADNGVGTVGVASQAKVMQLKVIGGGDGGGFISDVIKAIEYAKNKGVKIINISWASGSFSRTLRDEIDRNSDILFVASAGTYNGIDIDSTPVYPASFNSPNILTVTAVDNAGILPGNVDTGKRSVDIAAPGVSIISPSPEYDVGYGAQIHRLANGVNKEYKAIYNGLSFENMVADPPPGDGGGGIGWKTGSNSNTGVPTPEQQDAFNKAIQYLADGKQNPSVLLIDDDQSYDDSNSNQKIEDYRPLYEKMLNSVTGVTYETITIPKDHDNEGPDFDKLKDYDIVVWFTGTAYTPNAELKILTEKDQMNVTAYLNNGGRLLLSGQDALVNIIKSPFVLDMLGLCYMGEGVYGPVEGAEGTIYEGSTYPAPHTGIFVDTVVSINPMTQINLITKTSHYWYISGAHIATPYVSGAAALLLSQDPTLNAVALKERLMNSGTPLSTLKDKVASGRMLNAFRALSDDDIPGTPFHGTSVSNSLNEDTDINDVYAIDLHAGEKLHLTLTGDKATDFDLYLYKPNAESVTSSSGLLASSETKATSEEEITYEITETDTYFVDVFAYEGAGSYTLNINSNNGPGIYEDMGSKVVFNGSWTTIPTINGTSRQTDAAGSSLEFAFMGSDVEWIGNKNNQQGIAEVLIDGVHAGSPSLFSTSHLERQSIFKKSLAYGYHVIQIKWTGQRNGGGTSINMDALIVKQTIQETDAAASFKGPWMSHVNANHSGGEAKYSANVTSSSEFTFMGSEITLLANTAKNRGIADIYLDNVKVTSIDLYSQSTQYQVPFILSAPLSKGTHTIKVVNSGLSNRLSTGHFIAIDALVVSN